MGLAKTFWNSNAKKNFYKVDDNISSLTWQELRSKAKDLNIKYKDMKRPELEQAVLDAIK